MRWYSYSMGLSLLRLPLGGNLIDMTNRTPTPAPWRLMASMLALALLALLTCCSHVEEDTTAPAIESEPSGPYYDGSAFSQSDGRYRYDDGTTVVEKTGVDVSEYQGEIDWNAVAADGISFAFIRVGYRGNTEGGLYPDERFASNLAAAREAGIACGAYFYSQATSVEEAAEEATFVLGLLAGTQLDYPLAFDYEVMPSTRIAGVDAQTAAQIASTFCAAMREGGYTPMVYGNTFDLARFDSELLEGCAIWCAEYDDGPSYERKADIWQYTNRGVVNGIRGKSGVCDLNLDLSDVP